MSELRRSVLMKEATSSLAKKSAMEELLTSRGTSGFPDAIISVLFQLSSVLGAMSKEHAVLLEKIENIAQKVETISKEVSVLKTTLENAATAATNLPPSSEDAWMMELQELLNSPPRIPVHGDSLDLRCSETLNPSFNLWSDPTSEWNGSTAHQESVNQGMRMKSGPKRTSKSPEPSGGMDIFKRRKLS